MRMHALSTLRDALAASAVLLAAGCAIEHSAQAVETGHPDGAPAPRQTPAHPPEAPLPGGWRMVPATDPGVRSAAAFALRAMRMPPDRLAGIDEARQQVVAGMNYEMLLILSNGARWRVRVYRSLNGQYRLTQRAPVHIETHPDRAGE